MMTRPPTPASICPDGRDAPPVLCLCGGDDIPTRAEENRYFIALLQSLGHPHADYREFAGRDHGSIVGGLAEEDDEVGQVMRAFVLQVTGRVTATTSTN
jgi:hypothetical protein